MPSLQEFELINKIRKWLGAQRLIVPIGDDAAVFKLKNDLLTVFTADSLVENIHFKLETINPFDLGYKSLAVNISDIAAMGAYPLYATVCLSIPNHIDLKFIKSFYKGLLEIAHDHKITIVGGDITASNELMVSISLLGQIQTNKILKRSNAKPGDLILVTGNVGSSAAGLVISQISNLKSPVRAGRVCRQAGRQEISKASANYLLKTHFRPVARVKEAQTAAKLGVKSAIDISDGLVSDCKHICEESMVGCEIYATKIPLSQELVDFATATDINATEIALSGGEDYELLLTAPPKIASKLIQNFRKKKWQITIIGEITKNKSVKVIDKFGKPIKWKAGYQHFT